ncbi:hypothetical protein FHR83_006753 [Actinoplanes campanulatus]|uniref:DUF4352 domain-containing protein n=1 Tax=Actinoplanes campanulatus TaxID=113559 RepID=A0A7W5AMJ5_9ACTN|nr:DUF4352 domain-containing protein [Actinoplanes campanulatus]MBB3099047.1 hypothetical protein [Actinoplanes campanulatus]GGN39266.1 Mpr protein [Actinoplanes campanulatus]GID40205.1 Mpr protein [Actinoplanes campanulatus]
MSHQQSSYPPATGDPYSAPPPPKKKRWPWIVAGVVVVGILGCVGLFTLVLGGTAKVVSDAATEMDDNNKGKNAAAGELGKPAKDGKFEFTVTGMKCGAKKVGGQFNEVRAQGEFCQVSVTVKNVGTSAEIFDSNSQKAYDEAGTEYSVDSAAELAVNDDNQTWLENINPGNKIKGVLVFDVPAGTKPATIVVHESMFTAGVRVPLA